MQEIFLDVYEDGYADGYIDKPYCAMTIENVKLRLHEKDKNKKVAIEEFFMSDRYKLKNIDISELVNVEYIREGFLSGCVNLETIDLTPFTNVVFIDDRFLECCCRLKEIDLTPLKNVKKIGWGFLTACHDLEIIDLRPLIKIRSVGSAFLCSHNKLKKIICTKYVAYMILKHDANKDLAHLMEIQFVHSYKPIFNNALIHKI